MSDGSVGAWRGLARLGLMVTAFSAMGGRLGAQVPPSRTSLAIGHRSVAAPDPTVTLVATDLPLASKTVTWAAPDFNPVMVKVVPLTADVATSGLLVLTM